MNKAKLADLYANNPAVEAILDLLADRKYNTKLSLVKRIQFLLKQKGILLGWGELIAAFRLLQEAGCGTFIRGSRGYSSRFEWAIKTTMAAEHASDAAEEQDEDQDEEDDEEDEDEYELEDDDDEDEDDDDTVTDTLLHSFVLRPALRIELRLPASLTQTEADRLGQFVESLSFTDPFGDDEDEEDEEYDDEEIRHSYVLRPANRVALRLPADLTPREANRVAAFIRALPFIG